MSKSSSPKKNSITSSDEYDRLSDLYREAYDRVQSGFWTSLFLEKSQFYNIIAGLQVHKPLAELKKPLFTRKWVQKLPFKWIKSSLGVGFFQPFCWVDLHTSSPNLPMQVRCGSTACFAA